MVRTACERRMRGLRFSCCDGDAVKEPLAPSHAPASRDRVSPGADAVRALGGERPARVGAARVHRSQVRTARADALRTLRLAGLVTAAVRGRGTAVELRPAA